MHSHFLQKATRTALLVALLTTSVTPAVAWTGPSTAAPGGNTSAPINVSATGQTKSGNFTSSFLTSTGGINAAAQILASVPSGYGSWAIEAIGGTYGVYGSGSSFGVYGTATGGGGYAGYFAGNVGITSGGTLTVGNGTLYTNGDLYMPWAGENLSTYLSNLNTRTTVAFGGMWEVYSVGGCMVGNPWTGGCSCPSFAPSARYAAVGNSNNGSYAFQLYYCTG